MNEETLACTRTIGAKGGISISDDFFRAWSEMLTSVTRYCRHVTDNSADADDLVQVVALRAWRGFHSLRNPEVFPAWVMKIAERETTRYRGKQAKRRENEVPLPEEVDEIMPLDHSEPAPTFADGSWWSEVVSDAEERGAVSPAESQVVLARLAADGVTWDEIGLPLGLTGAACAVLHSRAVPKIRVHLLCHRADDIGGLEAIEAAYLEAEGLSPAERDVFEAIVLRRAPTYRRRGWHVALRRACTVVAERMDLS
ncbi:RNA polymerase sigma factor [Lentzea cavernae]|uniref:RNA polymerase sigma-70 region 2 domain-containing protein n=1 Tax=Lentzea cavernae TaxID=2020703 RepID=A0ABQ3MHM6_9PSEU|nr:sigma-70 family RNA polymerase sigma factor [Lentzea cavernae]GHH42665.1 hypothetical protein GCM10017774_39400 [Lentzea cavernae]